MAIPASWPAETRSRPQSGSLAGAASRSWAIVLGALGIMVVLLSLVHVLWAAISITEPTELMYGEAVLYERAVGLAHGRGLYFPAEGPPYTVAPYTPLFFVVTAALHNLAGPGFGPGRLFAETAGLAVAGAIAYFTMKRAGHWAAGLFAAMLFLSLGMPGIPPWSAMFKEHVPAVACSFLAIATLAGGTSWRRVICAALLAALAISFKQTLLAATLAGTVWLAFQSRSRATVFAALSGGLALLVCGALELATGAFLANTVSANAQPFRFEAITQNLAVMALFQSGPLLVALLHIVGRIRDREPLREDLILIYWLAAAIPVTGLTKVGSNHNYWIELAGVTAVLATTELWRRLWPGRHLVPRSRRGLVPALLLGVNLLVVLLQTSTQIPLAPAYLATATQRHADFESVVERVRAEPGEVLANPLDVVALADRVILFEPFTYGVLYTERKWDAQPLVDRICSGEVRLLVINHTLDYNGPDYQGYMHWPEPILGALRETMVLERQAGSRLVYAWRQPCAVDPRLS